MQQSNSVHSSEWCVQLSAELGAAAAAAGGPVVVPARRHIFARV